jgi:hypothetical protein
MFIGLMVSFKPCIWQWVTHPHLGHWYNRLDFYLELVDWFLAEDPLHFRGVVLHKKRLNHEVFNLFGFDSPQLAAGSGFINGLPLVVIELKNAAGENATVHSTYEQLQTYKHTISNLFVANGLRVASDGLEAHRGSLPAEYTQEIAGRVETQGVGAPASALSLGGHGARFKAKWGVLEGTRPCPQNAYGRVGGG